MPGAAGVDGDGAGDASGSGYTQQRERSRTSHFFGAFSEAAETDSFFIICFCRTSIFAALKLLALGVVLLSQRRL